MEFKDIPTLKEWKAASSSFGRVRAWKPKLVVIDTLIQSYEKVSNANRTALLSTLSRALEDWAGDKVARDVKTGRNEAMQALYALVQKKLDAPNLPRYREVVCIGYEIKIGGKTVYHDNLPERDRGRVKYKGDGDNTSDITGRCSVMTAAIQHAFKSYQNLAALQTKSRAFLGCQAALKEERVLKIFMAPEFFFRGPSGAYEIDKLWTVAETMRQETKDHKYDDWLFVLGTCVCSTVKTDSADVNKEKGVFLENFALVQKGGYGIADADHNRYVQKEYTSRIDYDRPTNGQGVDWSKGDTRTVVLGNGEHLALSPEGSRDTRPAWAPQPKNRNERHAAGCIFDMDGVTFGLEVCLDHAKGRLKSAPDKDDVQVHLIPSAGMTIDDRYSCENAVIFNVDGVRGDSDVVSRVAGPVRRITDRFRFGAQGKGAYFLNDGRIAIYHPQAIR
jgi:hypothetical protein